MIIVIFNALACGFNLGLLAWSVSTHSPTAWLNALGAGISGVAMIGFAVLYS